jgi:hypothetical protein
MARNLKADSAGFHRTLTPPGLFLVRMLIFLTLVVLIGAILHEPLFRSIMTNPGLNGLILAVLAFGVVYSFRQVARLYPEIRWVNDFRVSDPGIAMAHKPRLLLPMATMLRDRTGSLSLTTQSMSAIKDSLASRLDEARDTGRYLVGLLVFLGLLGTFWGLLDTIQSVGGVIAAIDPKGGDQVGMFDELKSGLAAPLKGMGTAFSSSLLGLAGSLTLGFLELQASHAHNRFYNELEEWLSGMTELTPGGTSASSDAVNRQLAATLFDMRRVLEELNNKLGAADTIGEPPAIKDVRELASGVTQLVKQMRAEQQVVREWVDEQAAQQTEVATVLKELSHALERRGS